PAPEEGPLLAGLDELLLHELALDLGDLVGERLAAAGLAAGGEVLVGLIEEGALPEGVLAAVAGLLDEIEALLDLALGVPVRSRQGAVRGGGAVPGLALGPGEGDLAGVGLLDQ